MHILVLSHFAVSHITFDVKKEKKNQQTTEVQLFYTEATKIQT